MRDKFLKETQETFKFSFILLLFILFERQRNMGQRKTHTQRSFTCCFTPQMHTVAGVGQTKAKCLEVCLNVPCG